jgi:hypothetical protein
MKQLAWTGLILNTNPATLFKQCLSSAFLMLPLDNIKETKPKLERCKGIHKWHLLKLKRITENLSDHAVWCLAPCAPGITSSMEVKQWK